MVGFKNKSSQSSTYEPGSFPALSLYAFKQIIHVIIASELKQYPYHEKGRQKCFFTGLAPQKSNIILSGEVHQQVSHHLLLDRQHSKPMQCFLSLFPEISNNPTSTLLLMTKPNSPLTMTSAEKTYCLQNPTVCFVKVTFCADGPF